MVYVTDDLGSSVIRLVFISSVINRSLCMTWMLRLPIRLVVRPERDVV